MVGLLPLILSASAPTYVDATASLGLSLANEQACWIDLDRDGWSDLVVGGVVWRNEKGAKFNRIADGVGTVVAADFDNDGYPDLFSWSLAKLFRSEKGKRFAEVAFPKLETTSRGACWGDFDRDGFVDLYVGGFEDWNKGITYPSYVLMNQRGKEFKVSRTSATHRSRGVTACDFDRDGALDVYVSNYRLQPNQLWRNDGKGAFTDVAPARNAVATSEGFAGGHSIGAAWGDFDNDGEFDLFAGNFAHVDSRGDQPKSRFLRNQGRSGGYRFDDRGPGGIAYQESYASPAAGDYDNDGQLDLFFTTVYEVASFGRPNHPVLYRNGGGFAFSDVTPGSGLEKLPATYQAAFADFRNDGRLALCTAGKLFANRSKGGHWLGVRLEGDGKRVNRSAIGTQVRLRLDGQTLTRQVEAGTGEGNQNDLKLHFGLGDMKRKRVDLEVVWPGEAPWLVKNVPVDRTLSLRYR
jgi:hypothetical protein